MNTGRIVVLALVSFLIAAPVRGGSDIAAFAVFGCDAGGTQDGYARWNTGPIDACWDLFAYEGQPGVLPKWLNDPQTHRVSLSPGAGCTTYTFHFESTADVGTFGLNLFQAGRPEPIISVYAPVTRDASRPMPFGANASGSTMGWPLSSVAGAGAASYTRQNDSLWICDSVSPQRKYTVTDFRILSPEAAGNVDLVGPAGTTPSGKADWVGQFTIEVENVVLPPTPWLLWAATTASMKIGPNNQDGTWARRHGAAVAKAPFSFVYGGRSSDDLLKDWKFSAEHKPLDAHRTSHVLTWTDPQTGLEVRWAGLEFADFESIEWTVYLKNTGTADTAIIEDVEAIRIDLRRAPSRQYVLHHWKGTLVTAEDFAPASTVLEAGQKLILRPEGTRMTGTAGQWPYYNLDCGDEGIILAIGWPGRWYAGFQRDAEAGLRITGGQEVTHLKLLPGETMRTPLIVMQFWKGGDWIDAQNTWRRWMVKHNIPRRKGGPLPLPMLNACSSHQFAEMTKANEQNQIEFIEAYSKKGLKLDYWWMDAGWYVGAAENGWPWTGTWEVDRRPHRFPRGLRAVSDHAHAKGVDTIVWFEPERVAAGTWLATEHPEWVLGGSAGGLLNLGDPDAWNWLVNQVDKMITDEGIDCYRQDYNIDPWPYWQIGDTPERRGMTENKYVAGYLDYWDELLRRHPGLLIDSCASGGHRNDLETMRRAVPLLRSDYLFEPVGQQGHTYGLSFWLPFHGTGYCPSNAAGWGWGTGGVSYEPYTRRSNMCPSNTGCFDFRVAVDDDLLLRLYREWLVIGRDYFGDYYPLTGYNLSPTEWLAWQFDNPETGEGFVQAFRRDQCIYSKAQLQLRGLDAAATYIVKNYDESGEDRIRGVDLMERGLSVEVGERPGAATVRYEKAN
ncbi:MAG: alpha-galactosidase [Phycisphaerae bacterium]|nr:alpha-galactosidase [Phycisphaerae bacterium]